MSGIPTGTVGDAVGVLIYTFTCLGADIILIWLLWVHRERLSYVALIAYFVAVCVISSIVQQIYQYIWYSDVMWERYNRIKANYPNAEVIFKNGNSGLSLGLSNLRFYCYIIECTYLFTYTLHIALSIYGVWTVHRRAERIYMILSKIVPPILTAVTIGLEYTPTVQSSWTVYMIVANFQAVASCVFSIVLITMILWKYVDTKRLWNNITTRPRGEGDSLGWKSWILMRRSSENSRPEPDLAIPKWNHVPRPLLDSDWLVMRLCIAIVFISGFILATLLVHLPVPSQMAREITADGPDLSPGPARASIIGYIYGVLPGLAIPIVFGLTKPFRNALYKTFVPRRWRTKGACGSDSEMTNSPAPPPEPSQDSDSTALHRSEGHGAISIQYWLASVKARMESGMPMDPKGGDSRGLSGGTSRRQKTGLSNVEPGKTKPKPLNSPMSFDSLIDWRLE